MFILHTYGILLADLKSTDGYKDVRPEWKCTSMGQVYTAALPQTYVWGWVASRVCRDTNVHVCFNIFDKNMMHLINSIELFNHPAKEYRSVFFSQLSPSAYCLVNRLTCCQRSLCECVLAVGQSDLLACLSQGGKWRPWYAISSRNVQTVWLLRQLLLSMALSKVCRR